MLMWYFARYRLSSCFSRLQGKSLQVWWYRPFTRSQEEIVQLMLHRRSEAEHPPQRFFFRRNAMQMAQFMPQGAMSVVLKGDFPVIPGYRVRAEKNLAGY